jgi:alpha-galactosidase
MASGAVSGSHGAAATEAEVSEAHAWAASALTAASPMFSFSYDGRPSSELLAGWGAITEESPRENQSIERTVTFTDPKTYIEIRCVVTEYADFPAVEWLVTLHNAGDQDTPMLDAIRPLDWRAPWSQDGVILHYSLGDSNDEKSFAPVTRSLAPKESAPFVLAPKGGRSSEDYMPFFNIEAKGRGAAMAVGWSGQWEAGFEYAGDSHLRVRAGMQTTHLTLHPGETIRTPRMLLVFWNGDDPLRGNNLMRQLLMAHYLPRRNGELVLAPICASTAEVAADGSYEGPHLQAMAPAAKRDVEVFWSDMDPQQWYPGGFPDGTGTWEPDPAKYPNGLKPIGDAAHAVGLQYLLWFEPERVAKGSYIARTHPDWVIGGANGGLFRLHLPEARAWLTDYIDVQVAASQIDWMRWDFNTQPLSKWRKDDAPDRQGMTEIRYIEGLYAMWDTYRTRHPGLVIDLCASGGRRIDLESLKRGLPLWHSDMPCLAKSKPAADQLQNAGLFRWVPMHGSGMFELEPSYAFRSNMTTGNILLPLGGTHEEPGPDDPAMRSVALYKKLRPYFLGDFYPLFPHDSAENVWYGYQFHRADLDAGMAMVFRREQCAQSDTVIHLKGLTPAQKYELRTEDASDVRVMTGRELAACAINAPAAPSAIIVYYKAVL